MRSTYQQRALWSICPDLFFCKTSRCLSLAFLLKIQLSVATEHRSSSGAAEWRLVEQSQPNDLGSGILKLAVSHIWRVFMMPLTTFKALFTYPPEKQSNWAILILLLLSLFYLYCQYLWEQLTKLWTAPQQPPRMHGCSNHWSEALPFLQRFDTTFFQPSSRSLGQ